MSKTSQKGGFLAMELNFYTPQNRVWKWKKNILRMAEKCDVINWLIPSLGKIYRDCFELPEFAIDLDKAYLD